MTILVGYASVHSATEGIAREMGDRLRKGGIDASVRPLNEVRDVSSYKGFVIGSAIHDQEWLPSAQSFLERFVVELSRYPVWLFSVCAVGDTASFFGPKLSALIRRARRDDAIVARTTKSITPLAHRHFAGALRKGDWSRAGELFLKLCGGVVGDHRDWQDVDAWADEIARTLHTRNQAKGRERLHLMVRGKP